MYHREVLILHEQNVIFMILQLCRNEGKYLIKQSAVEKIPCLAELSQRPNLTYSLMLTLLSCDV